jgi:membrane-associated phospholipid phosphatase
LPSTRVYWGAAFDQKGNLGEWIQLAFVSLLAAAGWLRPLRRPRHWIVTILALGAICAIVLARLSVHWLKPFAFSLLRDWLPAVLLLVPYWQIGQFFAGPDPTTQTRLAAFDRAFYKALRIRPATTSISVALGVWLELAYILVYPLVPLGLVALYATGLRHFVDYFWVVVLPATYICFAITPFVRALPPRMLSGYEGFRMPPSKIKAVNHGILQQASIQAITFPSGHVAAAMATTLVLLRLEAWVGLIFLAIALSIALATVVGGYHYVADVLLASLVALVVFLGTSWMVNSG